MISVVTTYKEHKSCDQSGFGQTLAAPSTMLASLGTVISHAGSSIEH